MSYSKIIPLVSPKANADEDGALIGQIPESTLSGILFNVKLSGTIFSYFMNDASGDVRLKELSSTIGTAAGDYPFGSVAAEISNGDIHFLGCDHRPSRFFVKVIDAGAYTGDLKFYDSSDGISAERLLENVNDPSNGFRVAGVHEIKWDKPKTDGKMFSPMPTNKNILNKNFIAMKLENFSGTATAVPKVRVWIMHDDRDVTWFNGTSVYSAAMDNGDFTGFPDTYLPVVGSKALYIAPAPFTAFEINVHRAQGAGLATWVQGFSASAQLVNGYPQFNTLEGVSDGSSDFSVGPAALGGTPVKSRMTWDFPNDWVFVPSLTLTMIDGSTQTFSGYMLEATCTAVNVLAPTNSPFARMRARVLGTNSSGISFPWAGEIAGFTMERPSSVIGTGEMALQLFNLSQHKASVITIPADNKWPFNSNDGSTPAMLSRPHEKNDEIALFYKSGSREFSSAVTTIHSRSN